MSEKTLKDGCCCSCGTDCCGSDAVQTERKKVIIDFLYLDLSVCTRCQGTENNLEEAIEEASKVLQAAGSDVIVNKIHVNTEELAMKHRFVSSPTIRVNGLDIQVEVKESLCESCGDLCGDEVDCRVWVYQGIEYTTPPKAMIIESILKAVYGNSAAETDSEKDFVLPENLKRFYNSINSKNESNEEKTDNSCCGSGKSDCSCC